MSKIDIFSFCCNLLLKQIDGLFHFKVFHLNLIFVDFCKKTYVSIENFYLVLFFRLKEQKDRDFCSPL